MTIVRIQKIIWNERTREHVSKHRVTLDEAKSVINSDALIIDGHSGKKILVNRTGRRILSIIVKMQGNKLEIVTARDASDKERQGLYEYEKTKTGSKI